MKNPSKIYYVYKELNLKIHSPGVHKALSKDIRGRLRITNGSLHIEHTLNLGVSIIKFGLKTIQTNLLAISVPHIS